MSHFNTEISAVNPDGGDRATLATRIPADETRLATAYHEAGHAVVLLRSGGRVMCVELLENNPVLDGQFWGNFREGTEPREKILQILAGYQAEFLLHEVDQEHFPFECEGHDEPEAMELVRDWLADDPDDKQELAMRMLGLRIASRQVVEQEWPLVHAIALALLERGRLLGEDVDEIAAELLRHRPTPAETE